MSGGCPAGHRVSWRRPQNLHALRRIAPPRHHGKIRLFRDLDPEGAGEDVPDPYCGDAAGFDEVLDIVTRTARALLDELTPGAR